MGGNSVGGGLYRSSVSSSLSVLQHGIGHGSCSIVLHEVLKVLRYAEATQDVTILRLGTCGGIGEKY